MRHRLVAGATLLAVVLGLLAGADGDAGASRATVHPIPARPTAAAPASDAVASRDIPTPAVERNRIPDGRTAYLTAGQPATLAVGETVDVAIAIDAPREVQTVSFRIALDPDVVQIRAVEEGNWTTDSGLPSAFAAELAPGDGAVHVRSSLPRAAFADRRADVAIVRMQAIAPGTSVIAVGELHANDSKGRPVPIAPSSSVAPVVRVESMLPGRP